MRSLTIDKSPSQWKGRTRASGRPGGKWKPIIHGPAQILLASDVLFSGLNRCMPQEELDLFQLPTGSVA
jgi:hypothetical protein